MDRFPQIVVGLFFFAALPAVAVLKLVDAGPAAAVVLIGVFAVTCFAILWLLDAREHRDAEGRSPRPRPR